MYSFPNLFITPAGSPMDFYVASPDFDLLKIYIEAGGGEVKDSPYGPYTIILSNACASSEYGVRDVFHTDFILNSCTRNSVVSLKNLRLKDTSFNDEFNPMDILMQTLTWKTAKDKFLKENGDTDLTWHDNLVIFNGAVPKVILKKVSSFPNTDKFRSSAIKKFTESEESESEVSDFKKEMADSSDSSHFSYDSEAPRASFGRRARNLHSWLRCEYTEEDDRQILNFIIKSDGFSNLQDKDLWTAMAKIMKQHSWDSLKNRFMKILVFKLHLFNLPPEIQRKFKEHTDKLLPSDTDSVSQRKYGMYTSAEDQLIQDYLNRKADSNTKLSGNEFWKKMEKAGIVKGRTWQSLRERYVKILRKKCVEMKKMSYKARKVMESPKKSSTAVSSDSEVVCNEQKHSKSEGAYNQLEEIETVMLSTEEEKASNSSEKPLEKGPKKERKHRRKLFSKVDDFSSPQPSSNLPTPVSVHITVPSRLDNEVNQYMRFLEFKKRRMMKKNMKASTVQEQHTLPKPSETINKAEACEINISKTLLNDSSVGNHKEVVNHSSGPQLSPEHYKFPRKNRRISISETSDSSVENHMKIINNNRKYNDLESLPKSSEAVKKIRARRILTSEASDSSDSSICKEALIPPRGVSSPKMVQQNEQKNASSLMLAGSIKKSSQLSCDLFESEASQSSKEKAVCSAASAASESLLQPWGGFTPEEIVFDDNEHPKGKGSQCESNAHTNFIVEGERSKLVNCKITSTQRDESDELPCSVLPLSPIMFEKGRTVSTSLEKRTPKHSKTEKSAPLYPNEVESSDENDSWSEDGLGWRGCAFRLAHKKQHKPLTECESSVENMINSESGANDRSACPEIQDSAFVDPASSVLPDNGTQESAFVDPVSSVSPDNGTRETDFVDPMSTVLPGNGTQESTFVDPVSTVSPDNGMYESACAQRLTEGSSTDSHTGLCSEQVSPMEIESPENIAEPDLKGSGSHSGYTRSGSLEGNRCATNKEKRRKSPRLVTSAQNNGTLSRSASHNTPVTEGNSETNPTFNFDFHTNRDVLSNSGIFEDIEAPPIRKRSCLSTPSPEKDKSLSPLSLSTRHVHWDDEKGDDSFTPIEPNQVSKRDACTSPISSLKNLGSMSDACTSPIRFEQVGNSKRRTCTCPCACSSPSPTRFVQSPILILPRFVEHGNNHEEGNQAAQLTPPLGTNRRTSAEESPRTPLSPQSSTMSTSPKSPAPGDIITRSVSRYDSLAKRTRSKTRSDSSSYGCSSPVTPPKRI